MRVNMPLPWSDFLARFKALSTVDSIDILVQGWNSLQTSTYCCCKLLGNGTFERS